MQELNDILILIDSYIGSSFWFPYVLIGTGLFFTIYLKFPQVRYFRFALSVVKGKFDKSDDEGDTSHFQALATALSGTVGTGNIAGVALAIHIGGPAALFWMLVTAAVGMCTKFVEVTLSHKYREKTTDGTMAGGPMYFMKNKMNMKWLAAAFAVATVLSSFGTGSLPQINSISNTLNATFGINHMLTGGVLAVLLGFVIIGGIKRIAAVTEKLVPSMAVIYFIGAFGVIFYNYDQILPSFASIFSDLFTGSSATGGFLGASIAFAFNKGVGRGLFSNEAGQGSAPIAHASAKGHEPVSEGMVAILEPFIDTIVICTITGLVLLSSGVWSEKHENEFQVSDLSILEQIDISDETKEGSAALYGHVSGKAPLPVFSGELAATDGKITTPATFIHARSLAEDVTLYKNGSPYTGSTQILDGNPIDPEVTFIGKSLVHSAPLTALAFSRGFFGAYGSYIVSIGILLFAFSTAISWSYYGDRAMTFLFGSGSVIYFRIVYVIGFFVASFTDTTIIWSLAGIAIAVMTLPNLFGLLYLRKDMKQTVDDFWKGFKKEYPEEKTPE
ncbi:alanine or glycine:cation symporter, AGCS family [Reichenbachiella agariperforans]|uniref:Alanine or glycine:cation symporter, AGCS family n=1 Tax=Reichenbachiella agariperforans TaxID=156994 RepID=A0A1M6VZZ0_REIAG|nr:amino acid carrier protein [Reichenbachiella agariperforans]SHK87019.1 alanine or glycine:cation symporter, AGCS family [Reichenbachiella agariperforans]